MKKPVDNDQQTLTPTQLRKEQAEKIPFVLRAWWMRDFAEEFDQMFFEDAGLLSLPIWSLHTDPKCDTSSIDIDYF